MSTRTTVQTRRRVQLRLRRLSREVPRQLGLAVVALLFVLPLYWLVKMSVGPATSRGSTLFLDLGDLTLDNYVYVLRDSEFLRWLVNSVVVSSAAAAIGVVTSLFAAYSLARLRFRGRTLFLQLVVVTQMIPSILVAIPLFVILIRLHLNDSLVGLSLTYVSLVLPFGVWMLYGFITELPIELEEAAFIDGANRFQVVTRVLLPVAAPGLATVGIFSFLLAWEDFLLGLMILSSSDKLTLTVAASRLVTDNLTYYGYIGAFGVLGLVPVMVIFAFLQKYIVRGLTAGAIK